MTVPIKTASMQRTELVRQEQLVSHAVMTANANRPTFPLERDRWEEWQLGNVQKKKSIKKGYE